MPSHVQDSHDFSHSSSLDEIGDFSSCDSSMPSLANPKFSHSSTIRDTVMNTNSDYASFDNTAIIFDWDDTLLCSSYLSQCNLRLDAHTPAPHVQIQLKKLETAVCALLETALSVGRVSIITNAEHGWVELSASRWIPGVLPLLQKVTIVSARTKYEAQFPSSPSKWKTTAFRSRLINLLPGNNTRKNVLSFGDSHVEREAIISATKTLALEASNSFGHNYCKSIKFITSPSTDQLIKQIELISNSIHLLSSHQGDLDLMLSISLISSAS